MENMRAKETLSVVSDKGEQRQADRPSRADAEEAIRTLIRWAGDDPDV